MGGIRLLVFVACSITVLHFNLSTSQRFLDIFCSLPYTPNTTYDNNLNFLLSSMSNNTMRDNTKFYAHTVGKDPYTVFGILQCRVDLSSQACKNCIETATRYIPTRCPNMKEVVIWYEECTFRYSYNVILSTMVLEPKICNSNGTDVSNPKAYTLKLNELMGGLAKAAGNTTNRFAVGVTNVTNSRRIFGLVQCFQDISTESCERCLTLAINQLPTCLANKLEGRFLRPSCVLWFEPVQFFQYNGSLFSPTNTNIDSDDDGNENLSFKTAMIIVVSSIFGLVGLFVFTYFLYMKKNKHTVVKGIPTVESLQFEFGVISSATDKFSDANKLGEGGFGVVYKGNLLDGRQIAVKRLAKNSRQGVKEFKNEVLLLAKLQHRNLVRLLGFSLQGEEKVLIYEYVPNGSLDSFIFDGMKDRVLDWDRCYRIIGGIARGLLYLHQDSRDRIIHRDLKGSNVLIDEQMLPKISDFGLARLVEVDQTQGMTNKIAGTYGYMAPEYAMHGHFSVKSDVFSFGVVVLEIITGRKNNSLFGVWKLWQEGGALQLIEPTLQEYPTEVLRCLHIGLLCVQEEVEKRPTMTDVALMLSISSIDMPSPSTPGSFCQ